MNDQEVELCFHIDVDGISAVDMELGNEGLTLIVIAGRDAGIVVTTRHIRDFAPGSVVVGYISANADDHAALIELREQGVPSLW